jgi:hypothetical protein
MMVHFLQRGLPLLVATAASASVLYVDVNSPNPVPPYTNWATAARVIQNAVDVATNGDQVLVTNGVYRTGGREVGGTNRVAVLKPIVLQSVNGPDTTAIEGYQVPGTITGDSAIRCVYLVSGASLVGFTVTNGAYYWGGGVVCDSFYGSIISNCVMVGNAAISGAGANGGEFYHCKFIGNNASSSGGGAISAYLVSCIIANNWASQGGGTHSCVLQDCLVTGNAAADGGGAYNGRADSSLIVSNSAQGTFGGGGVYGTDLVNCTVAWNQYNGLYGGRAGGVYGGRCYNCIVYNNSDWGELVYQNYYHGSWSNCCTTPLPAVGAANFTNEPLFANPAAGDFHLQSNSPCINSGNRAYDNLFDPILTDADGNPRIVGGAVDVGAYEFQSPASIISYVWLQGFGLAMDGSADFIDSDGDGMNNWQEWIAGTNPTNALSVLKMLSPSNSSSGITVSWQSVPGINYFLQSRTNLSGSPAFLTLQDSVVGQAGTTSFTDTTATGGGPYYYRVGVQP